MVNDRQGVQSIATTDTHKIDIETVEGFNADTNPGATTRGFTGHEHLDDVQLIHMNGRAYDPSLGRFLSVDPFIQGNGNSQGLNPYSYILNNPLAGVDPTGYIICDTSGPTCGGLPWTEPGGGSGITQNGYICHGAVQPCTPSFDTSGEGNGAQSSGKTDKQSTSGARQTREISDIGGQQQRTEGDERVSWVWMAMSTTDDTCMGRDLIRSSIERATGKISEEEYLARIEAMENGSIAGLTISVTVPEETAVAVTSVLAKGAPPIFKAIFKGISRASKGSAEGVETARIASTAGRLGDEVTKALPALQVPNAGGKIVSDVTKQDEVFFRVFSGDGTKGRFLTKVPPTSQRGAIEGLALPPGNNADFIQQVLVPTGTRLQRSRALPAFGRRGGKERFQLLDKIPNENFGPGVPFK